MNYKHTTQVPNFILDTLLPLLSESELKVLLFIVRQTNGWVNRRTGRRKMRDRISSAQFQRKTGYSRRVITNTIQSLALKQLICITDRKEYPMHHPVQRKGKKYLYYAVAQPAQISTQTCANSCSRPAQQYAHNKTNYPKLTETKPRRGFTGHISEVISRRSWK